MKILSNNEFKPFEINITIENKEDAAKLYALFNHTLVIREVDLDKESAEIRDAISRNIGMWIDYIEFHKNLVALMSKP